MILALAFAMIGVACLCASMVYYLRARRAHARADALTATANRILDESDASQRRAEDLLSRIQEHSIL